MEGAVTRELCAWLACRATNCCDANGALVSAALHVNAESIDEPSIRGSRCCGCEELAAAGGRLSPPSNPNRESNRKRAHERNNIEKCSPVLAPGPSSCAVQGDRQKLSSTAASKPLRWKTCVARTPGSPEKHTCEARASPTQVHDLRPRDRHAALPLVRLSS